MTSATYRSSKEKLLVQLPRRVQHVLCFVQRFPFSRFQSKIHNSLPSPPKTKQKLRFEWEGGTMSRDGAEKWGKRLLHENN